MTDDLVERPSPAPATHARRFKPHEIGLADGGRLMLSADGSIRHVDAEGSTTLSWTPDDPGWPDQAIRFGVYPQEPTVAPPGRGVR